MKSAATFVVVVLACVPAMGQLGGAPGPPQQAPGQSIDLELLELEQDADKALLREALLLQGRQGMKPITQGADGEKRQFSEEAAALRDFIDRKKHALTARAAELAEKRTVARRVPAGTRASQPPDGDRQTVIEKYEQARVEAQLLEAQIALLQTPMEKAIQALAKAELDASNDEARRPVAEAARREYDKIKAKVVEHNKRLQLEQQAMQPMQMRGMGGGGFR
jgi:hypothetical protein